MAIQTACRTEEKGDLKNKRFADLVNASPRIDRLRERYFTYRPSICIERARIVYNYYRRPENRSLPLILQKAGAFRAVLNEIPITIYDDELVVSSLASRPRAYPLFPENHGDLHTKELDTISTRWPDPFEISDADKEELQKEILPYWSGQSTVERFNALLDPEERKFFFKDPGNLSLGTGILSISPALFGTGGHITVDYPKLLEKGFQGIKDEAIEKLKSLDPFSPEDLEKKDFYQAVIECCDGMIEFGARFSALAMKMAENETDPQRKAELEKISEICARVPRFPARTFYEGLQSVWFVYVGILQDEFDRCCSLGRLDANLYPLYKQDMEEGRTTEEEVQELLDCLWMKMGETNFINWGSYSRLGAGFPVQQQIPVGGQLSTGEDATNPLTYKCIQATMNTRLHQPSLSVRLHKGSPKELYLKACQLARMGTGHPSFFNDEAVVPGLMENGIALEDARGYSPIGCVGVQVSGCGKGSHNGGYFNVPAALDFALFNGYWRQGKKQMSIQTGDAAQFTSFEDLWNAFEAQYRNLLRIHLAACVKVEYLQKQYCPSPYLSSLVEGCMESGKDKTCGGAKYNLGMSFRSVGLGDVADSLLAVKKAVFEEKSITMEELIEALQNDFEGQESLRQRLFYRTPSYGNDDGAADEMAQKVLGVLTDEFKHHKSFYGGDFQPGFGSVSAHWPFGKVLGAFPNGRKAGEPLADGIGPVHNHDQKGPTALLKSVSKMGHEKLSGGSILNVKFPPQVVEGERGLENFASFLKSFVDLKIFHCQFNIVNKETLRQAQKNPDNYKDLLVRVAGYSAYFTGLPKELQDDIIDRTEHYLS